MASRDSLEMRKLLAKGLVVHRTTDQPKAIRLTYLGGGSVTSVTVVTATGVTLITSNGGTDAYTFAVYTTMGALADAINADGIFDAKVLDCLRSDGSDNNLLAVALTTPSYDEVGNQVFDLCTDTSAFFEMAACLTPIQYYGSPKGHRVNLSEIYYAITVGTAAADSVQIWMRSANGTERQVYGALSVKTTGTTIDFASGNGVLTGNTDEDIIVKVKDAGSLADGGILDIFGLLE